LGLAADRRLLGGSAVLWIAFALRLAQAPEPFHPVGRLLKEPVVFASWRRASSASGPFIGLSIFIPLYVELVLGLSPSASGVILIAFMGGATVRLDGGGPHDVADGRATSGCRSSGMPFGIAALAPAGLSGPLDRP